MVVVGLKFTRIRQTGGSSHAARDGRSFSQVEVTDKLRQVHDLWTEYLAGLTDQDLSRSLEYQSLDAGRFRNTIEDIIAQLFGHSSYHRGQIASLVRVAGGEPAATDYIYWCREPVTQG